MDLLMLVVSKMFQMIDKDMQKKNLISLRQHGHTHHQCPGAAVEPRHLF